MGSGFLSGIFWGAIIGVALLFVSSQTLERQLLSFPKPQASAVEVPAGTEFDQAKPEADAVLPVTETRPEADKVAEVPVPDDAPDAPPAFDTSALQVPTPAIEVPEILESVTVDQTDTPDAPSGESAAQVGTVSELTTPEAPAIAPDTETETPIVSASPTEDSAPDASVNDAAPQVETEIAALPEAQSDTGSSEGTDTAPAVMSEDAAPEAPKAPEISSEPSLPTPDVTVVESEAPVRPAPIVVQEDAVEEEVASLLQPVEELDSSPDVETARLPQVDNGGTAATVEIEDDAAEEVESEEADETVIAALPIVRRAGSEDEAATEDAAIVEPLDESEADIAALENLPALVRYSVEVENPEGLPLLSLVLVNKGTPLTTAQLEELPKYLAFGVEASAADATEIAQHYRDAGREVVMIPSLPKLATPQDVEQALRVNFETIPEAVAVMDFSGGSFQSDREAVNQVVDVVAASGHGLITFPRGLNTAHQKAGRIGVPTGLIFRQLDADGEDSGQIQRTLDRAAFRARQDEAVILVGSTNSATLIALLEWFMGNRAESVSLAPISAALAGGG